ncbi:hypothetical protein [Rubritalea sp.]|uniref:hypothetical protein n=1 Tax=Rubritalea sp. TaxID=2109375 RepID=UPI003EFAE9B8
MTLIRLGAVLCLLFSQVFAERGTNSWTGQIVMDFIAAQEVSSEIDVSDYQIADNLQPSRRGWLIDRLKKKRAIYYSAESEFQVLASKTNGEAGIALVAITRPLDPFYEDILSIAFCRVDGKWKAAPIAGLFTYTGYGEYRAEVLEDLAELEAWAISAQREYMRDRLSQREREYEDSKSLIRSSSEQLLGATKEEVLQYFIEACRSNDIISALACVDHDTSDPFVRQTLVSAFNSIDRVSLWSTLMHEQYLYAVLPDIKETSLVSLGLYLPYEKKDTQQIIEFKFKKVGSEWYLELPHALQINSNGDFPEAPFRASNLHSFNQVRLLEVQQSILDNIPLATVESSGEIVELFETAVSKKDLEEYVELIAPEQRRNHFNLTLWKKLTSDSVSNVSRIYADYSESDAHLIYLVENWPRPERFSLVSVRYVQQANHWYVDPVKYSKRDLEAFLDNARLEKYREFQQASDENVLMSLLPDALEVKQGELQALGEYAELPAVFNEYEDSLRSGELNKLSANIAITKGGELSTLRAIGADARGRSRDDCVFRWVKVVQAENVAMGIVSLDYGDETAKEYLFYPFVRLKGDTRMIPSLLYYFEHGRGQALENRKTVKLIEEAQLEGFKKEYFEAVALANKEVERMDIEGKSK